MGQKLEINLDSCFSEDENSSSSQKQKQRRSLSWSLKHDFYTALFYTLDIRALISEIVLLWGELFTFKSEAETWFEF